MYPFHNTHAIFRIELEYGDGLLKWVIYRELRDFVNLHAHYRVANVKQGLNKLPPFPRTSIPYFNKLVRESKERGGNVPGKAEFAKSQRESLEDYLLRLIRSVVCPSCCNLTTLLLTAFTDVPSGGQPIV